MIIDRANLVHLLESVSLGLGLGGHRGIIQQADCFVFDRGCVWTYNEVVACYRNSPFDFTGAVPAAPLMQILNKLPDQEIDVGLSEDSSLLIKGDKKRTKIRMEKEVVLPIDGIEKPSAWSSVTSAFWDGVQIAAAAASSDFATKVLTCVHIAPDFLEGSDGLQLVRHNTPTGISASTVVLAESIKRLAGLDMTEMGDTENWLHFRNPSGLVAAVRKSQWTYPNTSEALAAEGAVPVGLPSGLGGVAERVSVFSAESAYNRVTADLQRGRIELEGHGDYGKHKEWLPLQYDGERICFAVAPDLLKTIGAAGGEYRMRDGRLYATNGRTRCVFVTALSQKDSGGG